MPLTPGTRIGHYELIGELGAGGMGEVYRARDTALGRDVAIKILPDQFLSDADRVTRFQREARTLAALNHPNIAHVYGLEARALVMELVEGDDLSAIIARGPISVADALPIARQIARALEASHEIGIVHRDLKPANIKVRADGTVKVLDFGLAKALGLDGANATGSLSNSPTMTSPATERGVILGTAAYMSPEQARGKPIDRRTDVWAFGVIVLEMLSGRRVFAGNEVSDVLASILKDAPPLDRLPDDTPAALRRLVSRCVQKDRTERLDSMAAAQLDIAEASSPDSEADVRSSRDLRGARGWRSIAMASAAAIAAATVTAIVLWPRHTPAAPPSSFPMTPIGGTTLIININQPDLAISPDGRRIAYASALVETTPIVVRSLDGFGDTTLSGLGSQPRSPTFSPDGNWMAYYTAFASGYDGRLMKSPVDGTGEPTEIAKVTGNLRGASWGADGTIVFASGALDTGLFRVPATGGVPELLTTPDVAAGEVDHLWPFLLPDGRHVLFAIARQTPEVGTGRWDVASLDLSTRKWRVIRTDASYPIYVPAGYLLFTSPAGLSAARFDPVSATMQGEAQVLLGDVLFKMTTGAADVSVSSTGTLVYVSGRSDEARTLVWTDREGRVTTVPAPPRNYLGGPRLSPDGERVALVVNEKGTSAIWIYDFPRATLMRLTPSGFPAFSPVWSESGRDIYFAGAPAGAGGIYSMAASGTGAPTAIVTTTDGRYQPASIRRGSAEMLIEQYRGTGVRSSFVLTPGAQSPLTPLNLGPRGGDPVLSPDGRWLAYVSDESGGPQIYLRPYPDLAADRMAISTEGGGAPRWSKTGDLFFLGSNSAVWVVRVGDDRSRIGKPTRLPPAPGVSLVGSFDVSPDGQRVLRLVRQQATTTAELRVVTNWFEVLRSKFPREAP